MTNIQINEIDGALALVGYMYSLNLISKATYDAIENKYNKQITKRD